MPSTIVPAKHGDSFGLKGKNEEFRGVLPKQK